LAQPSGLKIRSAEAGYLSSLFAGLLGRVSSSPPQFGQRPLSAVSAHKVQNVHSKEQIRASVESGGRSLLQHSQFGRNWSIDDLYRAFSGEADFSCKLSVAALKVLKAKNAVIADRDTLQRMAGE
jgi:hypothetical protein